MTANKRTTLGAIADFMNGGAWNQTEYSVGGVPVVRVTDIKNETVDLSGCKYLPKTSLDKYSRHLLQASDLVICTVGSHPTQPGSVVGRAAVIPESAHGALLNQNAVRIRSLLPDVDQDWLGYLGRSKAFHDYIISCARGSANQVRMAIGLLKEMPVEVPPIDVQRRVAGVLSAYDDLVDNSGRRIEILERMARSLYREWFVNFRFPGHERTKFVDSALGRIPEGWEFKKLDGLLDLDKGISYNGAGLTEEGNPMVNLKNIKAGGGLRRDATKPYSGDFKQRHTVHAGDVVVANTDLTQAGNVIASPALIPRLNGNRPILISHHLFAVRPHQGVSALFLYHLMLSDGFRGFAKGYAIGTTVLGLPKEGILNYKFACPSQPLIDSFADCVTPIHELVELLETQNDGLRRTRDLLLPRLLSEQAEVLSR